MRVAIIGGSGKMGRWFARFLLQEDHDVIITGRNEGKLQETKRKLRAEITTNNVAAVKNVQAILISVPIENLESVIKQIAPYIHPEQIIIDITSVKVSPVAIMHKHIKSGLVLGIHPMFGPGAKDIVNRSFILTPTDKEETALAQKVKDYLETRGARATLMSPDEHDEIMAVVLGLSHFIAIVSADTLLSFSRFKQMEIVSGITFKLLVTLTESVISEDPELYASLQTNLPKMAEIERSFQERIETWTDLVESKDQQKFAQKMKELKDRFNKVNPDFDKAYEDMYRLLDTLQKPPPEP